MDIQTRDTINRKLQQIAATAASLATAEDVFVDTLGELILDLAEDTQKLFDAASIEGDARLKIVG